MIVNELIYIYDKLYLSRDFPFNPIWVNRNEQLLKHVLKLFLQLGNFLLLLRCFFLHPYDHNKELWILHCLQIFQSIAQQLQRFLINKGHHDMVIRRFSLVNTQALSLRFLVQLVDLFLIFLRVYDELAVQICVIVVVITAGSSDLLLLTVDGLLLDLQ